MNIYTHNLSFIHMFALFHVFTCFFTEILPLMQLEIM